MIQSTSSIKNNKSIIYVSEDNVFIQKAKLYAEKNSLDIVHPTGAVIVMNTEIISEGANGSDYHTQYGCIRKAKNISTGESYELCPGCHPDNHAEKKAINKALQNFVTIKGSSLYLWGHWWCCSNCWDSIVRAEIDKVFLMIGSEKLWK